MRKQQPIQFNTPAGKLVRLKWFMGPHLKTG